MSCCCALEPNKLVRRPRQEFRKPSFSIFPFFVRGKGLATSNLLATKADKFGSLQAPAGEQYWLFFWITGWKTRGRQKALCAFSSSLELCTGLGAQFSQREILVWVVLMGEWKRSNVTGSSSKFLDLQLGGNQAVRAKCSVIIYASWWFGVLFDLVGESFQGKRAGL